MPSVNYQFYAGEKKYIGIDVTSSDAFTVSNPTFELITQSSKSVVIPETTAISSVISKGHRIRYLLDSDGLAANNYTAVFSFDRDSIEKRIKKIEIKIE